MDTYELERYAHIICSTHGEMYQCERNEDVSLYQYFVKRFKVGSLVECIMRCQSQIRFQR
jgi:hypothetical protein